MISQTQIDAHLMTHELRIAKVHCEAWMREELGPCGTRPSLISLVVAKLTFRRSQPVVIRPLVAS